jgi:hypothetical protein
MKKPTLVFILDRSTSMGGREDKLIPNVHATVDRIQTEESQDVLLVLFSDPEQIAPWPNPQSWEPQLARSYRLPTVSEYRQAIDGSTAILTTLLKTLEVVLSWTDRQVQLFLVTDGAENASTKSSWRKQVMIRSIAQQVAAMQQLGHFVGLVGIVREEEEASLRALAASLGISAVDLVKHEGDNASFHRSAARGMDTIVSWSTIASRRSRDASQP